MDTDTVAFLAGYDLVVNHTAHHIAYINKVFQKIAELLPEDGFFVLGLCRPAQKPIPTKTMESGIGAETEIV